MSEVNSWPELRAAISFRKAWWEHKGIKSDEEVMEFMSNLLHTVDQLLMGKNESTNGADR